MAEPALQSQKGRQRNGFCYLKSESFRKKAHSLSLTFDPWTTNSWSTPSNYELFRCCEYIFKIDIVL